MAGTSRLVFFPHIRSPADSSRANCFASPWYPPVCFSPTPSGPRRLVTSELLGVAVVPGVRYENADGSDLNVDPDYFSSPRGTNPAPGPFEHTVTEPVRVWPKATGGS